MTQPITPTFRDPKQRQDRYGGEVFTEPGDSQPLTDAQADRLLLFVKRCLRVIGILFVIAVVWWLIATASKPVPLDRDREQEIRD